MPPFANPAFAALIAIALTLSSIGAIFAVAPAQAAAPAAFATVELA
ncbi:hypothetical protein J3454_10880 [Erythrobacter sp. NFXS35]